MMLRGSTSCAPYSMKQKMISDTIHTTGVDGTDLINTIAKRESAT